ENPDENAADGKGRDGHAGQFGERRRAGIGGSRADRQRSMAGPDVRAGGGPLVAWARYHDLGFRHDQRRLSDPDQVRLTYMADGLAKSPKLAPAQTVFQRTHAKYRG